MALNHKLENYEIEFVQQFLKTKTKKKFVILDVGANRGIFTDLFLQSNVKCEIHGFEPIVTLYNFLVQKYKDYSNIYLNNFGISDCNKYMLFNELQDPTLDGCSSCIERPIFNQLNWKYKQYQINTTSIDNYTSQIGLNFIDFLKIDVEGLEPMVLKGCESLLSGKKIDTIYFEYGHTFADANSNLIDVLNFMKKYNYQMFVLNKTKQKKLPVNSGNIKNFIDIPNCNLVLQLCN